MKSANLFLAMRGLTEKKEDLLTEFVAAALRTDETFRNAYADTVLQGLPLGEGGKRRISMVSTQVVFPQTNCRPDMVLNLEDGRRVLCEHKIEAPEGVDEREYEEKARTQLEQYLELPVDGVVFFRASWKSPRNGVLAERRYLRPAGSANHFLWSDLYPALEAGPGLVTGWLRAAFAVLGWTPAIPSIGDLTDPDMDTRLRNRRNFSKLWNRVRPWLHDQGWRVTRAAQCNLMLSQNRASSCSDVTLAAKQGGRSLLVRVTPKSTTPISAIESALCQGLLEFGVPGEVLIQKIPRVAGWVSVVDVRVPMLAVLPETADVSTMEARLLGFAQSLLLPLPSRSTGHASATLRTDEPPC
jgi:hypothetical protein